MVEVQKFQYYWQITLNRPDVHNAFNPEMIKQLTESFRAASCDEVIRFVLLTANGKSFSAGADLNWMKSMATFSEAQNQEDAEVLYDMFAAIYNCSVPVVSLCHGNVFGGGLGLLAATDIVYAEEKTNFCFSEVKWGLAPATILPFVLRKIGSSASRDLMLSARKFSSDEAKAVNLVQHTYSQSNYQQVKESIVKQFKENGPFALRQTKALLREIEPIAIEEHRVKTAATIARCRVGAEGQAGIQFFLTKDSPDWKPND